MILVTAEDLGLDPQRFQVFEGIYSEIMPRLIATGFEPWSPADVMDLRNRTIGTPYQNAVQLIYLFTDCGVGGDEENIYVVPHSLRLRNIRPQTILYAGGMPSLRDESCVRVYSTQDHILDRNLTEQEARESQIWLDWADGDQSRLDTFVEHTFRLGREEHSSDTMMGIFIPADNRMPLERSLYIDRLYYSSSALGYGNLGWGSPARLIGRRLRSGVSIESQL